MVHFAADSKQWKQINEDWPDFAAEPRNIRFGLATDGINPFSVKRSMWSTWPVMLLNYNLSKTTKKYFIILSLINPGPKSVTGDYFDVFLQPLIEELQYGWSLRLRIVDASNYMGRTIFDCRFMVIWTIHDFLTLGVVSGCVTKGYMGCPCCGPATKSRYSKFLKKNVWDNQHRRYLEHDHSFLFNSVMWRRLRPKFRAAGGTPQTATAADYHGGVELRNAPTRPTAEETRRWRHMREDFLANGGRPEHLDPTRLYGIKRILALASLPYWTVSALAPLIFLFYFHLVGHSLCRCCTSVPQFSCFLVYGIIFMYKIVSKSETHILNSGVHNSAEITHPRYTGRHVYRAQSLSECVETPKR
jgi:hypothetical protein